MIHFETSFSVYQFVHLAFEHQLTQLIIIRSSLNSYCFPPILYLCKFTSQIVPLDKIFTTKKWIIAKLAISYGGLMSCE